MKVMAPLILPFLLMSSPSNEDVTYLQEQETIHFGLEEEVDLENSTVLWNGELLELEDDFSFTVDKEGKNTLDYVLKDTDGNIVEKGTKIYILDSIQPEIEVSTDSYILEQTIGVLDELEIEIKIQEDNVKTKEIYIDDILQEEKDIYVLTNKNKKLKIMVEDECGNQTIKEYSIESIQKPDCDSSISTPYSLENSISFEMDDSCQLSVNGNEIEGNQYSFYEPGLYSFVVYSKKYPYLYFYQQDVNYTNIEPSIMIEVSSLKGNQDVVLQASFQGDSIVSSSITSSNGQSLGFDQVNIFKAEANKDQKITVNATIEDAYGQIVTKEVTFQICTIQPTMELVLNDDTVINNEEYSFLNVDSVFLTNTGEKIETFILNGQKSSFLTLEEALKSMTGNDALKYIVHLKDEFGNENEYTYTFRKEVILQNITSTSLNRTTGIQSEREWSVDEDNHVTLKENKVETIQKPIVYIEDENNLQMGQTIDIVLMNPDDIQWLKVNGEMVDLMECKEDSLNNRIYSYTLPDKESLKIEWKDSQNEIESKEYTVQHKKIPTWVYSIFPIVFILGIVIGIRYV